MFWRQLPLYKWGANQYNQSRTHCPGPYAAGLFDRRLFYHENLSSVCPSYFRAGSGSAGPDRLLCGWKRRAGRQAARPAQGSGKKRGGYDPKDYQIDCYIHDQSPDIAGAVEPELAVGEDEDTLGAGDQGVMVGYACNETPEYLPMPMVAAQRLVTLLEISRMTGVIPDIGPDGKVQVTMEYNGDTPVRITTVVVSVQHKEDTDINKLADLLDEYVFPLAFDGMPADDAEIILNPSGKFVQGGPDADTGLTGRKLMVDSYGTFAPHGGGAFSGKDATKVDRSAAYMARFIAKNIVAAGFAQRCQVTLAYAIGEKEPVMVDVNTFGTGGPCEDDCLSAAVRKAYDLTPAGIIKQLDLLNPIYSRTAAGGHFGRKDFPWENVEHMSDLAAYIV